MKDINNLIFNNILLRLIIFLIFLFYIINITMFYIISKVNVETNDVILIKPSFEAKEKAIEKIISLLDDIKSNTYYINKFDENYCIDVYKKNIGFIYNSKSLMYKYKILEVNEPEND